MEQEQKNNEQGSIAAERSFVIDPKRCRGCASCVRVCPVGAISGSPRTPYEIDPEKCVKCGTCITICQFKAIR